MTRIIDENLNILQLEELDYSIDENTAWIGDQFGINLKELLKYAGDGLRLRNEKIAMSEEQSNPLEVVNCFATEMKLVNDVYQVLQPKRKSPEQY